MNNIHNTFHYLKGPERCIDDFESVKQFFVYDGAIDNNLRIHMVDDAHILNKETQEWVRSKGLSRPRLLIFLKNNTNSKIHLDVDTTVEEWSEIVRPLRLRKLDYKDYLRTCAINWVYDINGTPDVTGVTNWYKHVTAPDMITTTDVGTGAMGWLNENSFNDHLISVCKHTTPLSLFNTSMPHCVKGAQDRLCISLRFDVGDDNNPSYKKMLQIFGDDAILSHPEYNLTGTI